MVRMLSGVVNSAKLLADGPAAVRFLWARYLATPVQAGLPGTGWVRRYRLGSNSAAALGGMRHWLSLFCEVI